MTDIILADQIRAFVYQQYIASELSDVNRFRVRVGDVHRAMEFTQRVPLVCASLRSRKFQEQYGLRLVEVLGPRSSTTTTFIFAQLDRENKEQTVLASFAWAEVTSLEHGHGGLGWEIGRWLWSPIVSRDGANRYGVMREPRSGDQVFHLVAGTNPQTPRLRTLYGVSRVSESATITSVAPPEPGEWKGAEKYFRIPLQDFQRLKFPLAMDELEQELSEIIISDLMERPKYYPYSKYRDTFRGAQGIYLTKLSPLLTQAFREAAAVTDLAVKDNGTHAAVDAVRDFVDGERARKEHAFFRRNPALRSAAIAAHGLNCKACNMNFGEVYGSLGEGFIEIHHINPLAERKLLLAAGPSTTSVEDVVPLCANCHRMIHKKRPALSVEDVRKVFSHGDG